ncbi:sugar-binding protein [Camelliibacillus cellulosilyticus]|uniref:Sugar-binding protein n=1 Tax=Camelliibacillus cellulosilyticus TaxID=2174486 RepID=A0ABV9GME9_9BACL
MRFLRRSITIILGVAFCVALFFSLYFYLKALRYDTRETNDPVKHRPKYHFVLVPEEMDNAYWHLVEKGAKDAGKALGAAVEYIGPAQADLERHNDVIEEAIASKVDGIITQGLNTDQMTPVINNAIQHGIPVITVDTDDPESRRAAYIGTDNFQAGRLAGQKLAEATGGKALVGIVTGSFESESQKERVAGFKDVIKHYPGIKIVAIESSHITRIQAAEKTNKILIEHPDVNAFFGTSALDGSGISAVAQRYKKQGSLYIIGFDTLPETLKLLKEGWIDATVSQEPYLMGYKSVQDLVSLINGKQVPEVEYTKTKVIEVADLPANRNRQNGEVKAP